MFIITNSEDIQKVPPDETFIKINLNDDQPKLEFPSWIETITFDKYHHEIDNLPINLRALRIYNCIGQLTKVPPNLKELDLSTYNFIIDEKINNIDTLRISCHDLSLDNISDNIMKLVLYNCKNKINKLPKNLEVLKLEYYNFPLDVISSDVNELYIMNYKYSIDNLSDNIKKLSLDSLQNNTSLANLPLCLEELIISRFKPSDYSSLPINLRKLIFGCSMLPGLLDNLPNNLEYLYIVSSDSELNNLNIDNLPRGLKLIHIYNGLSRRIKNNKKNKFKNKIRNILGDNVKVYIGEDYWY